MPKTMLPRSIQVVPSEDAQQPLPIITPNPIAPVNMTSPSPIPSDTIQWSIKDIDRVVYAGDPSLNVNGHANFLEARASKLYIKSDGVYCVQIVGSDCSVSIESIVLNDVTRKKPLPLSVGGDFVSVTCFLRKGDVLALSANPKHQQNVVQVYDPNQRLHNHLVRNVSKCVDDKPCHDVCFSVSLL
jgi:hypothetical protein